MRVTPLDILQKQFRKRYKGFDPQEVRAFFQLLRKEIEDLLRENAALKEEVRKIENEVKEYSDLEKALRDTLLNGQEFVNTFRENAERSAALHTQAARNKAEELLRGHQQNIVKIHEDISELKRIRKQFKEEMHQLIDSSLAWFHKDDRQAPPLRR